MILVFILGAIVGSFLNVCIYRIPRQESIVFPSSHCPKCTTPLKWYELIPILSFVLQRGRCKHCGDKISFQYPIVEFLNALMYMYIYYHFSFNINFMFYCVIFSILIVISVIDYNLQIIPDSLSIAILISTIINKTLSYLIYNASPNISNSLLGLIMSSGIFFLIAILSKGGMGGGDIKLIGVLGLILGIKMSLLNILLSFILGAIISIFLILLRIKGRKDRIPFGPFICIAFMIVTLWGDILMFWYINIFIS